MVLIGGVATVTGSIMGAIFVVTLPRLVELVPLPFDVPTTGGFLTSFQIQTMLFGGLIVLFLAIEPRGLYGGWRRLRTFWDQWPFSY